MKTALLKIFAISTIFCLVLVTCYLLLVTPAHAATTTNCASTQQSGNFSYTKVIDDVNKCAIQTNKFDDKIFNWNQITGTACSLSSLIGGSSPCTPEIDQITAGSSALAGMTNAVALVYAVPPASGVTYMAQKFQQLNPVKDAYAQQPGIGFTALEPVERVWTAFRNISYVGFTIVFVVTGFMIMFRKKISSQAVATIQDSLPRLVIALILVTFSYAIAGLMIDVMYIVINLTISVLAQSGLIDAKKAQFVFTDNLFRILTSGWDEFATKTSSVVSGTLSELFDNVIGNSGSCGITHPQGCIGAGIAWLIGLVATLIFGIAMLFVMIKLFFTLLITYVTIMLLTVFAPFIFLLQALPGQNGAKGWFKQMAANIAVFPTVVAMILLAGVIAGVDSYGAADAQFKEGQQPFNPPLLGGFASQDMGSLVGLGIMLMLPSAAKMIKETIGVKDAGPLGIGMGAAMGAAAAGAQPMQKAAGAYASPYKQAYQTGRYSAAMKSLGVEYPGTQHPLGTPGSETHGGRGEGS